MAHYKRFMPILIVTILALGLMACGEYPGVPRPGQESQQVIQIVQAGGGAAPSSSEGGLLAEALAELEQIKPEDVPLAENPIHVVLKDFEIVPNVLRVKAGEVTFVFENTSTHTHNYRIAAWDNHKKVIFPGRPKVGANQKREVTIHLEPGVYYVRCNVSDHEERGMVGKLFVEP